MTKISGKYHGSLRTEMIHQGSNSRIETDAPLDNRGKGERFSPTDLVAAALGSCMLTILAIRARDKGLELGEPNFQIEKVMQAKPRKIAEIKINIEMNAGLKADERNYLEAEARACPVAMSLAESIKQEISFSYV